MFYFQIWVSKFLKFYRKIEGGRKEATKKKIWGLKQKVSIGDFKHSLCWEVTIMNSKKESWGDAKGLFTQEGGHSGAQSQKLLHSSSETN